MFYPLFLPIPIPLSSGRSTQQVYYVQHHALPPDNRVLLGNLPNDFLRVAPNELQSREAADHNTALRLQHQMLAQSQQEMSGRIQLTVVAAVLNKNYGMTRMDPYVRMRISHYVYETRTHVNGAKNPRWNQTFQVYQVPKGPHTLTLEIFDERTLSDDELIAWVKVPVPEVIYQGEVVDEWYQLSGKLGEGQEGTVNLVMSYTTAPALPHSYPVMMMPGGYGGYSTLPVYTMPAPQPLPHVVSQVPQPQPQPPPISQEDLKQLGEMFPSVEAEVVRSVLEASGGNKEVAINSLLQIQDS